MRGVAADQYPGRPKGSLLPGSEGCAWLLLDGGLRAACWNIQVDIYV